MAEKQQVLELLKQGMEFSTDIMAATGGCKSWVNRVLKQLMNDGVVFRDNVSVRGGIKYRYTLTPAYKDQEEERALDPLCVPMNKVAEVVLCQRS